MRHSATAEVISQSVHVSHCQLVQYYISQTHSCCWCNQSINTGKSLSVSPELCQWNTQLMLKQSVNQYLYSKSQSVSPVIYQSNTQLLLRAVSQWMHASQCQLVQYYISQTHSCCWGNPSINTVGYSKSSTTGEAISQSIYVSHCQLVQYYISQTHSYCWGNQSFNTCYSV